MAHDKIVIFLRCPPFLDLVRDKMLAYLVTFVLITTRTRSYGFINLILWELPDVDGLTKMICSALLALELK